MRRRGTANLDDIRRTMRLGMGPCQGGFCIYRATGILHGVGRLDGAEAAESLRGFLQERWKGVWPILYGDQLRQARLDDWIFQGLLDVEHLPERGGDRVSHHDVIVVGTGLAGLTAAVRLAEDGARVLVLAKGIGATHLGAGTIDVLGLPRPSVSSGRREAHRRARRRPPRSSLRARRRRRRGRGGGLVQGPDRGRSARSLRLHGEPGGEPAAADGGGRGPARPRWCPRRWPAAT